MATMILGTLGSALGPIGQIIGGLAGSYIDQLIFGGLQDQTIEGPRVAELKIPNFEEGDPVPYVLGEEARVPGQIIWLSPIKEVKVESGGGGGGGKGGGPSAPVVIQYEYYVDVAVAFCRQAFTHAFPVRKLWANGTLIYEITDDYDKTDDGISVTQITNNKSVGNCINKSYEELIRFEHDGGSESNFFAGLTSSEVVTISGNTDAVNNGAFQVVSIEQDTPTTGKSRLTVRRCFHDWQQVAGAPVGT